jgi:ligand-binding sensor domain-containing protein
MATNTRSLFSIHNNASFFTAGSLDRSKTIAQFEKFLTDNEEKINALEESKDDVITQSTPGQYLVENYGDNAGAIATALNLAAVKATTCDKIVDAVSSLVGGSKNAKALIEVLKSGVYSDGNVWLCTAKGRGSNTQLTQAITIPEQE